MTLTPEIWLDERLYKLYVRLQAMKTIGDANVEATWVKQMVKNLQMTKNWQMVNQIRKQMANQRRKQMASSSKWKASCKQASDPLTFSSEEGDLWHNYGTFLFVWDALHDYCLIACLSLRNSLYDEESQHPRVVAELEGLDNDDYDPNTIDDLSQDLQSQASEDVLEYNVNPKAAPSRVYIGSKQCWKVFQPSGDKEEGIQWICGGCEVCQHVGHWNFDQVGKPGIYETTKATKYTDGILHTYMSHEEDKLWQAEAKVIQMEVMECLMGSSTYQRPDLCHG